MVSKGKNLGFFFQLDLGSLLHFSITVEVASVHFSPWNPGACLSWESSRNLKSAQGGYDFQLLPGVSKATLEPP